MFAACVAGWLFLQKAPPNLRITLVGDSICQEMLRSPDQPLLNALQGRRLHAVLVGVGRDSDAFGSFTTINLLNLLDGAPGPRTDFMLVQAGTNDLLHKKDPSQVAKGLRMLITEIRRTHPESRILVASLTPIVPERRVKLPKGSVDETNRRIENVVQSFRSPAVRFVKAPVWRREDTGPDGIHLTWLGYRKLAAMWADALASQIR